VDLNRFRPGEALSPGFLPQCNRPLILYVGRMMKEKGVAELCAIAHRFPGTLVMVGEGPLLDELDARYPHVHFAGKQTGDDLVAYYQHARVFVFRSETDTSGLVLTEALACGLPVAALPVIGPRDIITDPRVGVLSHDLVGAVEQAMELSPGDCRAFAVANYSWQRFASDFLAIQVPAGQRSPGRTRWRPMMDLLQRLVAKTEDLLFAVEHQKG
jgi:glycosyltransferase involved in cell wall biosynthesis